MAESVIKSGRKDSFTVVYNSMLADQRLSLKAKGLMAMMLSFPENWEYSISGLAAKAGVGRDTVRSCLKELESVGYLLREQPHLSNGKFACNTYVLQDIAPPCTEKPYTVKPSTGKPSTGNRTQVNTQVVNTQVNRTPLPPLGVLNRIKEYAAGDRELYDAVLGLCLNRHEALGVKKAVKTERTINGILGSLERLSEGNRAAKLMMLDKAVQNNWLTVYALKPGDMPAPAAAPEDEEGFDGI